MRQKMRQPMKMLEKCANLAQNSVLLHFHATISRKLAIFSIKNSGSLKLANAYKLNMVRERKSFRDFSFSHFFCFSVVYGKYQSAGKRGILVILKENVYYTIESVCMMQFVLRHLSSFLAQEDRENRRVKVGNGLPVFSPLPLTSAPLTSFRPRLSLPTFFLLLLILRRRRSWKLV